MQVTKTTPSFTAKSIMVPRDLNKSRQYLYNEVLNIIKENKVPALIENKGIRIEVPSDYTKALDKVTESLTQTGIKFNELA